MPGLVFSTSLKQREYRAFNPRFRRTYQARLDMAQGFAGVCSHLGLCVAWLGAKHIPETA